MKIPAWLTWLNFFLPLPRANPAGGVCPAAWARKRCAAGVCKAMIRYQIDGQTCKGCGVCLKACPQGAIRGEKKKAHTLDSTLCIKCGICYNECKFGAIKIL